MSHQEHWTEKHIFKCKKLEVYVAFDEAGLPYGAYNTKREARKALIAYAAALDEAVYGDHNVR